MIYRLFFGFAGGNQGWQEIHAMQNASTNPTTLLPLITQLAQARANFLGAPFTINAVGLRKVFDETTLTLAKGSVLNKAIFTANNPGLVGGAEPADVALVGDWQPDVSNPALADFAGNSSQTHFGAPPDLAVNSGGIVDQGQAGLGAAFGTFRGAMIQANCGWLAVSRETDNQIASITQNTDGTISILLAFVPAIPPATNRIVTVRVRGVNNGQTPIPGQLRGYWITTTKFISSDAIGIPRPQIGGFLRTYSTFPTFVPYLGCILEGVVGNHKRGRPFGSPPGRRRKQVRG